MWVLPLPLPLFPFNQTKISPASFPFWLCSQCVRDPQSQDEWRSMSPWPRKLEILSRLYVPLPAFHQQLRARAKPRGEVAADGMVSAPVRPREALSPLSLLLPVTTHTWPVCHLLYLVHARLLPTHSLLSRFGDLLARPSQSTSGAEVLNSR